jgi:thiamine-phosphate pyrophosphorylase
MTKHDWRLHLVTDRPLSKNRPLEYIASEAAKGGATIIQLREKDCDTREFVELARSLKKTLEPLGVALIINDRVDVALAAGADGVHIGQSDMAFEDARRLLGQNAIIGLSVDNMAQALAAPQDAAYLGVSSVFPTGTKDVAAHVWGLDGLRELRAKTKRALVGIGGINAANAAEVIKAGADGIAVVSAICSAENPQEAARALRASTDAALAARKNK